MASVIHGEWTHRRGDPGGARAVAAEIDRPRPAVAWSWRPEHGGRVDQVRVAGQRVLVATMMPRDASAPGWEHAVLYALDATTGAEVARRVLADPAPVAAVVVDSGVAHVVATRKDEPIFWYALSSVDLVPSHRRVVGLPEGTRHDDVLDAWAGPDGGLWLELDATVGEERRRCLSYVYADADGNPRVLSAQEGDFSNDGVAPTRDACAAGSALFAPVDGCWSDDGASTPPGLTRLEANAADRAEAPDWARATLVGPRAHIHAVGSHGAVFAVAAAEDPAKPERVRLEAFAVDAGSGEVRWRAQGDRIAVRLPVGGLARLSRRPNGELLFQGIAPDASPRTPLVCARPDGGIDEIVLGARGRWVLDASLGELVLAHREDESGQVQVGAFAIDQQNRLLGRRAIPRWTVDAGDLGGGTTVYAGAGAVVVRGAARLCAVHL